MLSSPLMHPLHTLYHQHNRCREKELGACGLRSRTFRFYGSSETERSAALRTLTSPRGGVLLTTCVLCIRLHPLLCVLCPAIPCSSSHRECVPALLCMLCLLHLRLGALGVRTVVSHVLVITTPTGMAWCCTMQRRWPTASGASQTVSQQYAPCAALVSSCAEQLDFPAVLSSCL